MTAKRRQRKKPAKLRKPNKTPGNGVVHLRCIAHRSEMFMNGVFLDTPGTRPVFQKAMAAAGFKVGDVVDVVLVRRP